MRPTARHLPAALALATAFACTPSTPTVQPPAPAPARSATATPITADELRRDVFAFAADSFGGREAGTRYADMAARFIAQRLAALGLEPAGDSGYFHRVPLVRHVLTENTRFTVTERDVTHLLKLGEDLAPLTSLGPGVPEPKRAGSGAIIFAGYGAQFGSRDDMAAAARLGVRGRTIVIVHGAPAGADSATRARLEAQSELSTRLGRALQLQPAAIVVLMSGGATKLYEQASPDLLRSVTAPTRAGGPTSDDQRPFPLIVLGLARPGSPLLPANWPADDQPQALARTFSGTVDLQQQPFTSYNVVATVPGTDARLAATYVALGAHYDHVGVQPPTNGDSIANGADDDASGSMALLAIAARIKAAPMRRSALFIWHTAEEKGLLGSAHYAATAGARLDSTVAMINADMIGRNAPDSLYIIGPAAAPNGQSRVLGSIVDSVNARMANPFRFNREWDDPNHSERLYERSDHYNYARRGIPVVFFTTGLHDQYHKVSDEAALIDYAKLARVAEFLQQVTRALGDRTTAPR